MRGITAERLRVLAASARESATVAEDDRKARNAAIAEADREGWKLREISKATGLAVSHVQRIVVDATADAQAAATPEEAP